MDDNKILQTKLGYFFKDKEWLTLALTHKSASNAKQNNERLEFLGDSILSFVLSDYLYKKFPNAKEGILTRLRARLVCGETLANIAQEMSLSDHLQVGAAEFKEGVQYRASILADGLESIIGAIYFDSNLESCRECIMQWYQVRLNQLSLVDGRKKDPKTKLQEFLQAKNMLLPEYKLQKSEGEPHNRTFYIECQVEKTIQTLGVGSSRRKAEQQAAEEALKQLKIK